jgi:acetyl-CoA carboxylase biotin carboxylase subunit
VFKKVLVANRGEIAIRAMRACKELGIKTVAVYSEADKEALHCRYADEARYIGPASSTESYLSVPAIISAAAGAGADAIHPGYGFLSENPFFAQVCQTWGITFIGPNPEAIRVMGVKDAARATVKPSGVPVVPGSDGIVKSQEEALAVAEKIGYPVLVKAAAGGGGRGIRIAQTKEELLSALEKAGSEAGASFGSSEVYLEKYLDKARHIEFQVLADNHGNIIHLGERDSSIQRRRQKILEEAPSTILDPDLRERMSRAAVAAARAVKYNSAGTVEFLLDQDKNFYFIEMNTRIQVEHPVTEMITGIDLVKEQIRVAAGERLRYRQEDVRFCGWSIECRINAEDPDNNLLPSAGTISGYEPPGGPGTRVDSMAYAGFTIKPYYDSLIGKLIVWGEDREEARRRMIRALDEFRIEGIKTSIPVHKRILQDPAFINGQITTEWLEKFLKKK